MNLSLSKRFQRFQFPLILLTAFLDIVGLGILIPSFPAIVAGFGVGGEWVGYSMAVFALGTFIGGFFFGKWSDTLGRRAAIMMTTSANIWGFLFLLLASGFPLFLIGRFIAGLAGGGIAVIQAYMSDISAPADRAKNIGLIGAMFGIAFLVGPAIGGILAPFGLHIVALAGVVAASLNLILIYLLLPEPVRVKTPEAEAVKIEFSPRFILLLSLTFLSAVGFAPIQSLSGQYLTDTFAFSATMISYVLIIVGISAILYQWLAMRWVRRYMTEVPLLIMGFGILTIALPLFAFSPASLYLWFLTPLLAIWNGSIMPAIGALISARAGGRVGAYLGLNSSAMSVGNIIGPTLAGVLYSHAHVLPFYVAGGIYFGAVIGILVMLRRRVFA